MQDVSKTLTQVTTGVQAALAILSTSKTLFSQAEAAGIPVPMDARVQAVEKATQALAEHIDGIKLDDQADDQRVKLLTEAIASLEKDVISSLTILRDQAEDHAKRIFELEKYAAKLTAKPAAKSRTKAS